MLRTPGKRSTQIAPDHHGEEMSHTLRIASFFGARLLALMLSMGVVPIPVKSAAVRLTPHCSIMAELA